MLEVRELVREAVQAEQAAQRNASQISGAPGGRSDAASER